MKNTLLILSLLLIPALASCQSFRNLTEKGGKIGIGTTQPDELLTVKGKIHTREVLVDLKGAVAPDYVFENYFLGSSSLKPDYRRMSLQELELYIRTHHHLPGIASAGSMEEEGMELKAMNLKLLEKIEELTLHTIEQQKQIDELSRRLQEIEQ